MSILKVFLGTIGIDGDDGDNGSGVADIRGSLMDNPLISGLYNNKLSRGWRYNSDKVGRGYLH